MPGFLKTCFSCNNSSTDVCFLLALHWHVVHSLTHLRFNPERIPIFQDSSIITSKLCFNLIPALKVSQRGNKWELWSDCSLQCHTEDFWYLQQCPLEVSEPELSEPHFTHRVGSCWESVATFLPPLWMLELQIRTVTLHSWNRCNRFALSKIPVCSSSVFSLHNSCSRPKTTALTFDCHRVILL